MPRVVAIASAEHAARSAGPRRARARPEERLGHEVLRQPLHQQQRDPAEQRRRPAAGSGRCAGRRGPARRGRRAGRRGRSPGRRGSYRAEPSPVDRAPRARGCPTTSATRDEAQQPRLEPARPRPDRSEDARQGRRGRGAAASRRRRRRSRRRARSSRSRTWPIWSSSPKPSGATPSTRRPLTYVPFVLPRSSTYQLRPR